MSDRPLQQKLYPYDGSQDVTKNPLLISPTDIVDSNNIIYTTYSTKKKRPGIRYAFNKFPTSGRHVLAQTDYWRLNKQYVVIWDGKYIWAIDGQTGVADNITGDFNLPTDQTVCFLKFFGLLIIFFGGGKTPIKYWNQQGTIQNLINEDYTQPFGSVYYNRLVIPDLEYPGRILLSKTNDPTDFLSGDATSVDCGISDGDPEGVTGIFPEWNGLLYVGKRLSLWQISPQYLTDNTGASYLTFVPKKITTGVGVVSHNGIVSAENDIFFVSDRGFHSLVSTRKFSQYETNFMSLKIQPAFVESINFNRSQYIQGVYDIYTNSLIWVFPINGNLFPSGAWGYSLMAEKWFGWSSFGQTSIGQYINPETYRLSTMVGANNGNIGVLDHEVKTDYGQPIPCFVMSGIICPNGAPDDQFEFDNIMPLFVPQSAGTFRIVMKIDGAVINDLTFQMHEDLPGALLGVDFVLAQSYLGGISSIKGDNRTIMGTGMTYQLFIEHDGQDAVDFEILGILVNVDINSKKIGTRVA